MSHWVTYTHDVLTDTDMSIFERAINEMGLGINYTSKHVENSWGHSVVDFAITKDDQDLSIGFKTCNVGNHTKLELRGDFFVTGLVQSTFMDQLAQKYQSIRIQDLLVKNNWSIENTAVNEENEIIIDAYEYVLA